MEKRNNENIDNGKAKVVSSTSNSYNNIQPRVVLQRLSKDYTFGVASGSDNQPSTSGYLSPKSKSLEVDSSLSDDTSDSTIHCGAKLEVAASTSRPATSGTYYRRRGVIEFRVAPLRDANLSEIERLRSGHFEDSSSDCSFHSSPKEVLFFEDKTETEEGEDIEEDAEVEDVIEELEDIEEDVEVEEIEEEVVESEEGELSVHSEQSEHVGCQECIASDADFYEKSIGFENIGADENRIRQIYRTEAKVTRAITFLKLLIDAFSGRRSENAAEIAERPASVLTASPVPIRRPLPRSIVIRPQRNNLKDCIVRVWLSVRGQKKKKKFHVKLSQLILLLKDKNHPLHKFRNTLNLRTLTFLTDNELRAMARVLSNFVCAKRVKF